MKKVIAALALLAIAGSVSAKASNEIINYTEVPSEVGKNGERVIQMPERKKTLRRRMLVDFGLFGAGVHVGWLKPKNAEYQQVSGETVEVKKHHGFGSPIFNVSAGTHALGLGTK